VKAAAMPIAPETMPKGSAIIREMIMQETYRRLMESVVR
jgi:hypothetical protein